MTRGRFVEVLCWASCAMVLGGLLFGLDPYRRLPLQYGYGPDLRAFFTATLDRARRLDIDGSFQISPDERWHLVGNWETPEEANPSHARASPRRAVLLLPILTPANVEVEIELRPLPEGGYGPSAVDVEYGVNGVTAGRLSIPPEGTTFRATVPAGSLYRGDNTLYLYRSSRRGDRSPWLAVGEIVVRREEPSLPRR
jgi:hypothetical protein